MDEDEIASRHESDLKTSITSFRQNCNLTDVTVTCGSRQWEVHSLILNSVIDPDSQSILASAWKGENSRIDLPSTIPEEVWVIIMDFMYSREVRNFTNNLDLLRKIVSASHCLQVNDLFQIYLQQLAEILSRTHVSSLLELLKEYRGYEAQILSHLTNKFCHLHLRKDFLSLTQNELKIILENITLDNLPVDQIVRSVLKWVKLTQYGTGALRDLLLDSFYDNPLVEKCLMAVKNEDVILTEEETVHLSNTDDTLNKQKIFCFSNEHGFGIVRAYDVDTHTWSSVQELPFSLFAETISVQYSGHVYFLGGYEATSQKQSNRIHYLDKQWTKQINNYCPAMNKLVSTDSLSLPVARGGAGVLQGKIYVISGNQEDPGCTLQCYNPATGKCAVLSSANIDCSVYPVQVTSYARKLWVTNIFPTNKLESGYIECYDPSIDQWTTVSEIRCMADIPTPCIFSDGKLFQRIDPSYYRFLYPTEFKMFTMSSGQWTTTKPHSSPIKVERMWSVKKEGRPIILVQEFPNILHSFDVQSSEWTKLADCANGLWDYWTTTAVRMYEPVPKSNNLPSCNFLPSLSSTHIQSDVIIECNEEKLKSHRLILSASSQYFLSMFTSDWDEKQTGRITFPTISTEVMTSVLQFVHTGRLPKNHLLNRDLLIELFKVSHLMELPLLSHLCLNRLSKDLSMESFHELYDISKLYSNKPFTCRLLTFLALNFHQPLDEVFLKVDSLQLKRVLQHPALDKMPMDNILSKILYWVQYDVRKRYPCLIEMISCLDLRYLSDAYQKNELVIRSPDVKKMIQSELSIQRKVGSKNMKLPFSFRRMIGDKFGRDSQNGRISKNGQKLLCFTQDSDQYILNVFDVNSNQWCIPIQILSKFIKNSAVVGYDRFVYFLGGELKDRTACTYVYKYCPITNSLTGTQSLKCAVAEAAAGVLDDSIYVVGGRNKEQSFPTQVQRLTVATSSCDIVSPTQQAHIKPELFSFKDKLYIYCSDSMESYDSLSNQWTVVTHIPKGEPWSCSAHCLGKVYFLRGNWELHVHDLLSGSWGVIEFWKERLMPLNGMWSVKKHDRGIILVSDVLENLHTYDVSTSTWQKNVAIKLIPDHEIDTVVVINVHANN